MREIPALSWNRRFRQLPGQRRPTCLRRFSR